MPGRRRKIKCTFIHGDSRCANCLARGTQCVDQRDVDGVDDFAPEDSATTLRERVAGLERQLADVMQTLRSDMQHNRNQGVSMNTPDGSDIEPTLDADHEADVNPQPTFQGLVDDIYGNWNFHRQEAEGNVRVSISEKKASKLCKTLRSNLPDFDTLLENFQNHGSWWSHWRRQVQSEGEDLEDISDFVHRSYASRHPGDLGSLIAAYARHTWRGKVYLYGYIESMVISDAVYSSTIEGLECLILVAQCYMDVGQPRRAWLVYQRGIALARIMVRCCNATLVLKPFLTSHRA